MKNIFLFSAFFLFSPTLVFAQIDEKTFLNLAQTWANKNIQCKEYQRTDDPFRDGYKSKLGKCNVSEIIFGHFNSSNSKQLVLGVTGQGWIGLGTTVCDAKYIFFDFKRGNLSANIFAEFNSCPAPKLFIFPNGPDCIWIAESPEGNGSSNAHLYTLIDDELKEVLTYEYGEIISQTDMGSYTFLIPLKNRDLKLIKFINFIKSAPVYSEAGIKTYQKIYIFDSSKGKYTTANFERSVPFLETVVELSDQITEGDVLEIVRNKITGDEDMVEQLIGYMKLSNNDLSHKRAHLLLSKIAWKDLGDTYDAWEQWKKDQE